MLVLLSTQVMAKNQQDPVVCQLLGLTRKVVVEYPQTDQPVPCRVVYLKVTEGITDYPWHAQHESGYCEAAAEKLVTKLQALGWQCKKVQSSR
jgi:hypothetical protein